MGLFRGRLSELKKRAWGKLRIAIRRATSLPGETVPRKVLKELPLQEAKHMEWWKEHDPSLHSPLDLRRCLVGRVKPNNYALPTQVVWSLQKIKIKGGKTKEVILRETCHLKKSNAGKDSPLEVVKIDRRAFNTEGGTYFADLPSLGYNMKTGNFEVTAKFT